MTMSGDKNVNLYSITEILFVSSHWFNFYWTFPLSEKVGSEKLSIMIIDSNTTYKVLYV